MKKKSNIPFNSVISLYHEVFVSSNRFPIAKKSYPIQITDFVKVDSKKAFTTRLAVKKHHIRLKLIIVLRTSHTKAYCSFTTRQQDTLTNKNRIKVSYRTLTTETITACIPLTHVLCSNLSPSPSSLPPPPPPRPSTRKQVYIYCNTYEKQAAFT